MCKIERMVLTMQMHPWKVIRTFRYIKSCPFCGADAELQRTNDGVPAPSWHEFAQVVCTECYATSGVVSADAGCEPSNISDSPSQWRFDKEIAFNSQNLIDEVIAKWNKRKSGIEEARLILVDEKTGKKFKTNEIILEKIGESLRMRPTVDQTGAGFPITIDSSIKEIS
jgi:hypothetical protein